MLLIHIRTDNAAFEEAGSGEECARILREIASKLEAGRLSGKAVDANGNTVGDWEMDGGE